MQRTFRPIFIGGALALLALLTGCATLPPGAQKDPRDPFERFNRTIYNANDVLARKVALPIGHGYQAVTPAFVRRGIANVFQNARLPDIMINDLLQAKFMALGKATARLLLNTTVGIGGLLDPATQLGLPKADNDFGRTLGTWGAGPGPFLMLPLLGPSDVRDAMGKIPDAFANPQNYIGNKAWFYGVYTLNFLNTTTETLIPTYRLLDEQHAFDPYGFARNAFLQRREFLIHGDSGTGVDQEELDLQKSIQDDPGAAPPAQQPPPQK